MKITPFFRWYDLWVGVFIDTAKRAVYICPLPMVGIKIYPNPFRGGPKPDCYGGNGYCARHEQHMSECENDVLRARVAALEAALRRLIIRVECETRHCHFDGHDAPCEQLKTPFSLDAARAALTAPTPPHGGQG